MTKFLRHILVFAAVCLPVLAFCSETADASEPLNFIQGIRDILSSTSVTNFFTATGWKSGVMVAIGFLMLYLGAAKDVEPLLMLPIGFGTIFVNASVPGMPDSEFITLIFDALIATELLPILVFMGIGAMSDFSPLIANPRLFVLGAAAQFGVFGTLFAVVALSDAMGFGLGLKEVASIAIIGAADGPTSIFISARYAPKLMGAIAVAAYSYMALVPLIQPPVMRLLTTKKERCIHMPLAREVTQKERVLFPVAIAALCALLLPMAMPLIGSLALGNFIRECGVAERLSKALQNEIMNTATLLLGLGVAVKLEGSVFLTPLTLGIFALGLLAFVFGTAGGIVIAKLMNRLSPHSPLNPLLGSAGVSAFPMAARVSHKMGQEADPGNYLIFHAMGANLAGQIGSVIAAGVILALLK